jgi:hypothetical protein
MPIMLDDLQTTIKITVSEYGEYELGWVKSELICKLGLW